MEDEQLHEFNKILIPLDGSKLSENALRYGVSIASKYKASIVLVSVFSSKESDSVFRQRIEEMDPKLACDIEKMPLLYWMECYHDILKSAIRKQKIPVKSILRDAKVSTGAVIDILLDVVEKEKIDLVIISSHGKSGFRKLKLGSATEGLIRSLSIPVICVKQ
jgi:nucleotide-binding universal stress UspA family protein